MQEKKVCSLVNRAVGPKPFRPRSVSHQWLCQTACHLTSIRCRCADKTCYVLSASHTFPQRLGSRSWLPKCI